MSPAQATVTFHVPLASFGTVTVTTPLQSVPVTFLVVLPFLSLSVTLPVALELPLAVVIVTLYLPAFLLVGRLGDGAATLLALALARPGSASAWRSGGPAMTGRARRRRRGPRPRAPGDRQRAGLGEGVD